MAVGAHMSINKLRGAPTGWVAQRSNGKGEPWVEQPGVMCPCPGRTGMGQALYPGSVGYLTRNRPCG